MRTLRTSLALATTLALVLVAVACRSDEATASPTSEAAAAEPAAPRFAVTVAVPPLAAGAEGKASIVFTPGDGFKWNLEYPAKVTFSGAPQKVSLAKTEFKQLAGDFESSEKKATVAVPLKAAAAGEEVVVGEARFSVCNATTCLIETAEVKLAVAVE